MKLSKVVDFQEKSVFSSFQILFLVSMVVDFQLNRYLLVEVGRYIHYFSYQEKFFSSHLFLEVWNGFM